MRATDSRRTYRTMDVCGYRLGIGSEFNAFGLKSYLNTLCFEGVLDRCGHFRILVGQETRLFFYHGDIAAKSSIHLRELKADVTSADNKQMRRQLLEF